MTGALDRPAGALTTAGSLAVRFVASMSRAAADPVRTNAPPPTCRHDNCHAAVVMVGRFARTAISVAFFP
ncbi:hypothetical protein [Nocardia acidivorans]|uniref:hypothetical protein n=1 Tax=Nocardia acidivorans TaxID=404580 RepID=UPI0008329E3F